MGAQECKHRWSGQRSQMLQHAVRVCRMTLTVWNEIKNSFLKMNFWSKQVLFLQKCIFNPNKSYFFFSYFTLTGKKVLFDFRHSLWIRSGIRSRTVALHFISIQVFLKNKTQKQREREVKTKWGPHKCIGILSMLRVSEVWTNKLYLSFWSWVWVLCPRPWVELSTNEIAWYHSPFGHLIAGWLSYYPAVIPYWLTITGQFQ